MDRPSTASAPGLCNESQPGKQHFCSKKYSQPFLSVLDSVQNTIGDLNAYTWAYKRGEPPQLQRDSWAVCSLFNIDLDRLRYSKLLSDGRSRIYKDITRQTHIGIHKKLMVVTIFYIYECMCAGLPVAISVMDYDFVRNARDVREY